MASDPAWVLPGRQRDCAPWGSGDYLSAFCLLFGAIIGCWPLFINVKGADWGLNMSKARMRVCVCLCVCGYKKRCRHGERESASCSCHLTPAVRAVPMAEHARWMNTHTQSCEGVKISMTNQKDLETCSQWATKGWTGQEWGLQIDRHLSDRKKHEKRKWGRVTIWEQTCCWGKKKKRWELRAKSDDCSC